VRRWDGSTAQPRQDQHGDNEPAWHAPVGHSLLNKKSKSVNLYVLNNKGVIEWKISKVKIGQIVCKEQRKWTVGRVDNIKGRRLTNE